jgi:hypothetical protein
MTVLSDEAILSAIDMGELEIEPFNADNLTPNGYDLTIDEIEIPQESKVSKGSLNIPPGARFAPHEILSFVEIANLAPGGIFRDPLDTLDS